MRKFPTMTQLARQREQEIIDGYHDDLSDEEFESANRAWNFYLEEAAEHKYEQSQGE